MNANFLKNNRPIVDRSYFILIDTDKATDKEVEHSVGMMVETYILNKL
jgi:hypothetical protein